MENKLLITTRYTLREEYIIGFYLFTVAVAFRLSV